MFAISYSTPVNGSGHDPHLTREQVWRGLVMKAEKALPFVPGMEKCEVLQRDPRGLLREVRYRGETFREKVTFTEPVQVHFERVDDRSGGWITNVISDSPDGLLLTFTFVVSFPEVEPGSEAEQARGAEMRSAYMDAVRATLPKVRQMAAAGELSD